MPSLFPQASEQTSPLVPAPHAAPASEPCADKAQSKTKATAPSKAKQKSEIQVSATPYKEGLGYAMRQRYQGRDIYLSGHDSAKSVIKAMRAELTAIDKKKLPAGKGPARTTLAQALQDYAMARLPFMKGAVQDAVRINHYLRYAGLQTLVVTRRAPQATPVCDNENVKAKTGKGAFFEVKLQEHSLERKIANGLSKHRKAQLNANAGTEKHRAVLASTLMNKITRASVQEFMDAMRSDGNAAATMALERSMLRVLFNYADRIWNWTALGDNPAVGLAMPAVENVRKRVMSASEEQLLDAALATCRSTLVAPMLVLLRETAMRSSEPLKQARWKDVDWERKVLTLGDSKSGAREVPLSPLALQALQAFEPGEPDAHIVEITYESLKKSWTLACKRAGIENLQMHDLRRTAATRMALKTGNVFLVKALTGHKTMSMMERYINVGADDVVNVMHQPQAEPQELPVPASAPVPGTPVAFTLEQMQSLMQQTVQSTLDGLRQLQPAQGVPGEAALPMVPPIASHSVRAGLSLVAPLRRMV